MKKLLKSIRLFEKAEKELARLNLVVDKMNKELKYAKDIESTENTLVFKHFSIKEASYLEGQIWDRNQMIKALKDESFKLLKTINYVEPITGIHVIKD